MTESALEKVLELLATFKSNTEPTLENLKEPNYQLYANAPFWEQHQAVCLLVGLAPIDRYTLAAIVHLRDLDLLITKALEVKKRGDLSIMQSRADFSSYVIHCFPIPHDIIVYLKNVYEWMENKIKEGLKYTEYKKNNVKHCVFKPEDVILAAESDGIIVPPELKSGVQKFLPGELMRLPNVFPDQIVFFPLYEKHRYEMNQRMPRSLLCLSTRPAIPVDVGNVNVSEVSATYARLTEVEIQASLRDLLYSVRNPARNKLFDEDGISELIGNLQKLAPCSQSIFQQALWSLEEAFFVYHNIDPYIFDEAVTVGDVYLMSEVVTLLDRNERLFRNLCSYLESKGDRRKQISHADFLLFLSETKYEFPQHMRRFFNVDNSGNASDDESSELTAQGKKIYEEVVVARGRVLDLGLQHLFPDADERAQYLRLIQEYGTPSSDEFKKIKEEGRKPLNIIERHECCALGKLLRFQNPKIKIKDIKCHPIVVKFCEKILSNIEPKTFGIWMNDEGIYDKQRVNK